MVQVTEQVAAFNKSQLDALLKFAGLTAENMEKLADVQFKAAKSAYADSIKSLKQLAAVKDVNELASVTTGIAQPALEKATAYTKSVYDVVSSAQSEFASVLEEQVAEFNKNMVVTLDAAMKSAPAGSEGALAAGSDDRSPEGAEGATASRTACTPGWQDRAVVTEVARLDQAAPYRRDEAGHGPGLGR